MRSSTKVRSVELRNCLVLPRGELVALSSTKVRSVELRNDDYRRRLEADDWDPQRKCEAWSFAISMQDPHRPRSRYRSSTKVRSVELRNNTRLSDGSTTFVPQRKCEAWSFAIPLRVDVLAFCGSSTKVRSVELRNRSRSRSPRDTWLLNESAKRGASQSVCADVTPSALNPQRKCEAWSFAMSM